jgi:hypothetical protein
MVWNKFNDYSEFFFLKLKIELSKIKSSLENGTNIRNDKFK